MRCPAAHGFMRERGYFDLGPLQPVGPVEGCELAALIRVHDLGWAEFVDRLVQRLEAELGLPLTGRCLHANTERGRVRYPPGQHLAGEPVHALRRLKAIAYRPKDRHQREEPFAHRQIGDVGAPDLVGLIDAQPAQQIRLGLVALRRLAGIGFLLDRHQSHKAHQPRGKRLSFTAWPSFCRCHVICRTP